MDKDDDLSPHEPEEEEKKPFLAKEKAEKSSLKRKPKRHPMTEEEKWSTMETMEEEEEEYDPASPYPRKATKKE